MGDTQSNIGRCLTEETEPCYPNGTVVRIMKGVGQIDYESFQGKVGLLCGPYRELGSPELLKCRVLVKKESKPFMASFFNHDVVPIDDEDEKEQVEELKIFMEDIIIQDVVKSMTSASTDTFAGPLGTIVYCSDRDAIGVVCFHYCGTELIVVAFKDPIWAACRVKVETLVMRESDSNISAFRDRLVHSIEKQKKLFS